MRKNKKKNKRRKKEKKRKRKKKNEKKTENSDKRGKCEGQEGRIMEVGVKGIGVGVVWYWGWRGAIGRVRRKETNAKKDIQCK